MGGLGFVWFGRFGVLGCGALGFGAYWGIRYTWFRQETYGHTWASASYVVFEVCTVYMQRGLFVVAYLRDLQNSRLGAPGMRAVGE